MVINFMVEVKTEIQCGFGPVALGSILTSTWPSLWHLKRGGTAERGTKTDFVTYSWKQPDKKSILHHRSLTETFPKATRIGLGFGGGSCKTTTDDFYLKKYKHIYLSLALFKQNVWVIFMLHANTERISGSCLYLFACMLTGVFVLLHLPGFLSVKFQSLHDSLCLQRNHMTERTSANMDKSNECVPNRWSLNAIIGWSQMYFTSMYMQHFTFSYPSILYIRLVFQARSNKCY